MRSRTAAGIAAMAGLAATLGGCATVPSAPSSWLAGTDWAVVDVNQVDVSARSDFTVHFTQTRFDARFGCRRVSGRYTLRAAANGDPEPVFQGSDAVVTGDACTGSFAESVGPEILGRASLVLSRDATGRLLMLEPPTDITLRPL